MASFDDALKSATDGMNQKDAIGILGSLLGVMPGSGPVQQPVGQDNMPAPEQTPTSVLQALGNGTDPTSPGRAPDNAPQAPSTNVPGSSARPMTPSDEMNHLFAQSDAADKRQQQFLKDQQDQVNLSKAMALQQATSPTSPNLQGGWMLADALSGRDQAKNYKPENTPEQQQEQLLQALKMTGEQQQGLTEAGSKSNPLNQLGRLLGLQARQSRFDDTQVNNFVQGIDKDPTISAFVKTQNLLRTDHNTLKAALNGNDIVTPQLWNEIGLGYARALNGPGVLPEAREQGVQYGSGMQKIVQNVLQPYLGQPMNAVPAAMKAQMDSQMQRLEGEIGNRISERALQKLPPQFENYPGAKAILNRKLGQYGASIPGMDMDATLAPKASAPVAFGGSQQAAAAPAQQPAGQQSNIPAGATYIPARKAWYDASGKKVAE